MCPSFFCSVAMTMSNEHIINSHQFFNNVFQNEEYLATDAHRPPLQHCTWKSMPSTFVHVEAVGHHVKETKVTKTNSCPKTATYHNITGGGRINSAPEKVPISGLGPDRDQCPNMVPKKARFAYYHCLWQPQSQVWSSAYYSYSSVSRFATSCSSWLEPPNSQISQIFGYLAGCLV